MDRRIVILTNLLVIIGGLLWGMIAYNGTDIVHNNFPKYEKLIKGLVGVAAVVQSVILYEFIKTGSTPTIVQLI